MASSSILQQIITSFKNTSMYGKVMAAGGLFKSMWDRYSNYKDRKEAEQRRIESEKKRVEENSRIFEKFQEQRLENELLRIYQRKPFFDPTVVERVRKEETKKTTTAAEEQVDQKDAISTTTTTTGTGKCSTKEEAVTGGPIDLIATKEDKEDILYTYLL